MSQHPIDHLVRRAAAVTDAQLASSCDHAAKAALLEEILVTPIDTGTTTTPAATPPTPTATAPAQRRRSSLRRWAPRVALPVAIVTGLTVLTWGGSEVVGPGTPAVAALVEVEQVGDELHLEVVDPEVDIDTARAAVAEAGIDVVITTVPVSPSLVGTIVMLSQSEGGTGVEPLREGTCVSGGGGCAVGVRVPEDFSGSAEVVIGRVAEPGEAYTSHTSIWAPGEALACTDLRGERVDAAVATLADAGFTPQFRQQPDGDFGDWYVEDVLPASDSAAFVFVTPSAPGERPAELEAALFDAC